MVSNTDNPNLSSLLRESGREMATDVCNFLHVFNTVVQREVHVESHVIIHKVVAIYVFQFC